MKITVEKRWVQNTGIASLGWQVGYGYRQEKMTVKQEKWCVVKDGKVIAQCKGKPAAEEIAAAFDWVGHCG